MKNLYKKLAKSNNILLKGLITISCPGVFIRSIYSHNKGKRLWNKKKTALTISFDCDHPQDVEAFPQVLKILKKYDVKTSFACVGYWIEKYPDLHKLVLDAGHEIINHTYSHPDNEILNPQRKFIELSYHEKKEEIVRGHEICRKILNYEPIGCRIPHFSRLFTPEIYSILKEINYKYSSSTSLTNTYSFGNPYIAQDDIIEFPLTNCLKHPFTVFDTWHSFNSPRLIYRLIHSTEEEYWQIFKELINIGIRTNSYINIYIDPKDVLILKQFELILDYLKQQESDIWLARYYDLIEQGCYFNKEELGS